MSVWGTRIWGFEHRRYALGLSRSTYSGELRKQGENQVADQPFQALVALIERPREVLTRDELHKRLWPADTTVDFDRGLNKAINRLREALGDDADSPQFIETLPQRGIVSWRTWKPALPSLRDRRRTSHPAMLSS